MLEKGCKEKNLRKRKLSVENSRAFSKFPLIMTVRTVPAEAVELLDFIHLIFKVLTISMRFEPSNAKYFSVEVSWDSITTVLRLTGAFGDNTVIDVVQPEWKLQGSDLKDKLAACHSVFKMDEDIQSG
ncbi:hypothetical protein ANCDUO_20187 [Ancylostoma duodenale]|uniref:Uncharacterized protein n=1 Tax=Ancylostoma duodenale TaxID=51022 RepID=A0A0C2CIW9_9BILA|nr:hypothetical protein ANCDUO_20187 [Ancylostoma duodenale]